MAKKNFIIDTSVFLSDANCVYKFQNNDIFIPLKVLEEIDLHKKRQDTVGHHARQAIRMFDSLRAAGSLSRGVRIAKGLGVLRVIKASEIALSELPRDLTHKMSDHLILATALTVKADFPKRKTVVVSRDINMRVIADALGLLTEDYTNCQVVEDSDKIYEGFRQLLVDEELINQFYLGDDVYLDEDLVREQGVHLHWNEFVMLVSSSNEKKTALARFSDFIKPLRHIRDMKKELMWGVYPRNKEQSFAFDLLFDDDIPLVSLIGKAGSGKAQPLDAKVLTPNGWKQMGEISVGDSVFSRNGKPTEVLGVFPQGEKEIYRITFSDGTSTECCKEHLWATKTQLDRDQKKKGSVKTLEEIMKTLRYGKAQKKNHSIPIVSPIQFEANSKCLLNPYLLGSLLGDGCISVGSPTFSTTDKETVDILREELVKIDCEINKIPNSNCDYRIIKRHRAFGGGIRRRYRATNIQTGISKIFESIKELKTAGFCYPSVNKTINGKQISHKGYKWELLDKDKMSNNPLKDALMREGLWGKKSENKFIPEQYKFNHVGARLMLLRGLMDTDGHVSKDGRSSVFCSISKRLAEDVAYLTRSLGGKAVISSRHTLYTHNEIKKQGRLSYRVRISLPEGMNPFLLKRKSDRWLPNKKTNLRKYVDKVEPVGTKKAQCIMVKNSEHLYITDECIVTHNTLMAIAAALEQGLGGKHDQYRRIIISRPVQPLGKDIGYLPGTMEEKMLPWLKPIQDNIRHLMGDDRTMLEAYVEKGKIEVEALTYIRGRSISNAFVIIDEAQNLTAHEVKTIITRIGENTKIVLTGDIEQIDNVYTNETSNGLTYAVEKFKESELAGHITFRKGERSKLATAAAKLL